MGEWFSHVLTFLMLSQCLHNRDKSEHVTLKNGFISFPKILSEYKQTQPIFEFILPILKYHWKCFKIKVLSEII